MRLAVVGLTAWLVAAATPAQAFILLGILGAGGKPRPSPTEIETVPGAPPPPLAQTELPAPFLARPVTPPMALPQHLAQSGNEEILRRLERLERENQELRSRVGRTPSEAQDDGAPPSRAGGGASAPRERGGGGYEERRRYVPGGQRRESYSRDDTPSDVMPAQAGGGSWWLHLHPYNTDSSLEAEPIRTYRYANQTFSAAIGVDRGRYRGQSGTQMYVFRLEGFLTVRQEGSYQLGFEINCGFGHPCNVSMKVGGQEILGFRNANFDNQMRYTTRQLPAGNYKIEIIYGIARTNFGRYQPHRVNLTPKIRAPGDMNFRGFSRDELSVPDRRDVVAGPPFISGGR